MASAWAVFSGRHAHSGVVAGRGGGVFRVAFLGACYAAAGWRWLRATLIQAMACSTWLAVMLPEGFPREVAQASLAALVAGSESRPSCWAPATIAFLAWVLV